MHANPMEYLQAILGVAYWYAEQMMRGRPNRLDAMAGILPTQSYRALQGRQLHNVKPFGMRHCRETPPPGGRYPGPSSGSGTDGWSSGRGLVVGGPSGPRGSDWVGSDWVGSGPGSRTSMGPEPATPVGAEPARPAGVGPAAPVGRERADRDAPRPAHGSIIDRSSDGLGQTCPTRWMNRQWSTCAQYHIRAVPHQRCAQSKDHRITGIPVAAILNRGFAAGAVVVKGLVA